ncbi:4'-phosphopantetheinyl transferase family protein [Rugamonas apoptosis]|uniref:4'-phosphopantetheinyl transferase superfamily protein n=1 Tax=Rugamonas apoptosis TaxID=2758570 RepID=A0A7W2FCU8_9BURK|nr:4'-phosphopantetheinyl transferase superfamily protein [Rugamonas apoptosis]MBA5689214.1 4'-phosphopantetheinyl transferase superfamily protein [Rugamonas apoptosis]
MQARSDSFPVHPWPGPLPVLTDGCCVIAIATNGCTRPEARQLARQALRQVLAGLLAVDASRISLPATPGQPQSIVLDARAADTEHADLGHAATLYCSISHETGWSLVAISLNDPVGIDVMAPQDIDDWAVLARDYLGPQVAQALAACPPAARARALAQAWTAREASLKCRGQQLTEWVNAQTLACRDIPLAVPAGLAGSLAMPENGSVSD